MMELRITSPQEGEFVKEIQWNHEELKKELTVRTEKYRSLVLTEDDISYGKKERAALNKFKDAMEAGRKRVKNSLMEPYQKFEAQYKDVMAPVEEAVSVLDKQVKEYEEAKRVEKTNRIRDIYEAQVGTLRGILPFERVLKKQWLNVSTSLKSIEAEIMGLFTRVNSDLDTIEGLGSRHDAQIRDVYIRTLDLSAALQEKGRLEEQERQLAERRAAKEAEAVRRKEQESQRAAAGERERQAYLETRGREPAAVPEPVTVDPVSQQPKEEDKYLVGLEACGTRAQLEAFQAFLKGNGIFYRVTMKPKKID